jgi:hypothetical protein
MTVTTAPAEGALEPFVDEWTPGPLDRIGEQFKDLVELLECHRILDEQSARGSICM